MIIRATKKVLNLSRIPSVKNNLDASDQLPGEWYVDLVSLGRPGKFGLQFLHSPTYISIVVPGRSLTKSIGQFKIQAENFLQRHGYGDLIPHFSLDTVPEIFSTNSRSMLAHMNQIKMDTIYNSALAETIEDINYTSIEDIFLAYPFKAKHLGPKYHTPQRILKDYMERL